MFEQDKSVIEQMFDYKTLYNLYKNNTQTLYKLYTFKVLTKTIDNVILNT